MNDAIPEVAPTENFFNYFTFVSKRYIDSLLLRIRKDVYDIFIREFNPTSEDTILDVGASRDDHISSNYLEKHYPYTDKITALSNIDASELERLHPGLRFVQGDGRKLPFADKSFDIVFSHAVIEHVGSRSNQGNFIKELTRVSRKGVVFTTPNRWHPVETHIGLPFIQYLPPQLFRKILTILGKDMYATEENLNLLDRRNLLALIKTNSPNQCKHKISEVKWLGISSNLVAVVTLNE
jgi:hypothetical protein